jgi:Eukaryotic aspartyl protease
MHPFSATVFLFGLLVALVAAVPASLPSQQLRKRSFKVERFRNPNFVKRDGTAALAKAYRKYGIAMPEELIASLNKFNDANTTVSQEGEGNVTATEILGGVEFVSPVQIGGQTINMDFDSGSSDLWVFGPDLPAASKAGHTVFDPGNSATFNAIAGASFSIQYGDGSGAAGEVGTDTVNIGGATVTSQAVELATAVSSSFVADKNSNGLLGLAYSKLNTVRPTQQKTFFDNVLPSLTEPVFTADLRAGSLGSYEFGVIDTTKFSGSLSWAPINTTRGFWQFSSTKFQVSSGTSAGIVTSVANGQAIADTGTTLILVNPAVVNAYYSQVNGAVNDATVGGITFPCDANLPDLSVDIGGEFMARVSGRDINFAKVDKLGTSMSIFSFS